MTGLLPLSAWRTVRERAGKVAFEAISFAFIVVGIWIVSIPEARLVLLGIGATIAAIDHVKSERGQAVLSGT